MLLARQALSRKLRAGKSLVLGVFYRLRDAGDALSLTRGLAEKDKKQLRTSGAVMDGESASWLRRWTFSGKSPKFYFSLLPISANVGPRKLSGRFKTLL